MVLAAQSDQLNQLPAVHGPATSLASPRTHRRATSETFAGRGLPEYADTCPYSSAVEVRRLDEHVPHRKDTLSCIKWSSGCSRRVAAGVQISS